MPILKGTTNQLVDVSWGYRRRTKTDVDCSGEYGEKRFSTTFVDSHDRVGKQKAIS
jgi:hypothetical protein